MSIYTTTLKRAIEMLGGTVNLDAPIPTMTGDIGLSNYPLFEESYRERLNGLILGRYANREIGLETVGMFRFALRHHMLLHMPTMNLLYESTRLEFDPLHTIDIRTL